MRSCNPNTFLYQQQGRLIYPGTEDLKTGPERPQRISRMNRTAATIGFGCAVTDAPPDGCAPPQTTADRILGFTLKMTAEDVNPGEQWFPDIFDPGYIVIISQNDRIKAVAPCDVFPGEPVFVEPGTGMPAKQGLPARGCTWETKAMEGSLAVIQINVRVAWT